MLAAVASALVLVVWSSLLGAVVVPPDEVLTLGPVVAASAIGAVGAAVVLGVIGRFSRRPVSSVAGKKGWANASAYCASKFGLTGFTEALADEGKAHGIRAIVLYPGAMNTNWGAFSPEERRRSEPNEAPATQVLAPERVADFIAWFVASPPEFVLTEGIVLPIEEGLP